MYFGLIFSNFSIELKVIFKLLDFLILYVFKFFSIFLKEYVLHRKSPLKDEIFFIKINETKLYLGVSAEENTFYILKLCGFYIFGYSFWGPFKPTST